MSRHFYSWCLAVGKLGDDWGQPVVVQRTTFRKAVEESAPMPGKMWSHGCLSNIGKRLVKRGLLAAFLVSSEANEIMISVADPREQYDEAFWNKTEAEAGNVSGRPDRLDRVTPQEPAELPSAVLGDLRITPEAKHLYGYLMERVRMSGKPHWQAPYLIPTQGLLDVLNSAADEVEREWANLTTQINEAGGVNFQVEFEDVRWDRTKLHEVLKTLGRTGANLLKKHSFAGSGPHEGCLRFRPANPRSAYAVKTWNEREEQGKTPAGRLALWRNAHCALTDRVPEHLAVKTAMALAGKTLGEIPMPTEPEQPLTGLQRKLHVHRRMPLGGDAMLLMVLLVNKLRDQVGDAELAYDSPDAIVRWETEAAAEADYRALAAERRHEVTDQTFAQAHTECLSKGFAEVVEDPSAYAMRLSQLAIAWANDDETTDEFVAPLVVVDTVVLSNGETVEVADLIEHVKQWRESLDLTGMHDRFPDVTMFHESVVNQEDIGPYERRVLAVQFAMDDLAKEMEEKFGPDTYDMIDIAWYRLLTDEEGGDGGPQLGKTLMKLIRGGYAWMPGLLRMDKSDIDRLDNLCEMDPDAGVSTSIAFTDSETWPKRYSESYLKMAAKIAKRHGQTVRRAQLTLPHDPCPCKSGKTAAQCCQVHSTKRSVSLLSEGMGIAERYRVIEPADLSPDPDKIQRNAPCPCWSGKKYKKCCGKPGRTYDGLVAWFAASWRGTA